MKGKTAAAIVVQTDAGRALRRPPPPKRGRIALLGAPARTSAQFTSILHFLAIWARPETAQVSVKLDPYS